MIPVVNVGEVANVFDPVPVLVVNAASRLADHGVAKNVATPVPNPVTPPTGSVQFVKVPDVGVPRIGVTKLGVLAKTKAPVPVSSVTTAANNALDAVARNVTMPDARPVIL